MTVDETIKILGHGQGGAEGAGMEYELNLLYKEGILKHKIQ